ncbi:hypothetical protein [Bacillus cereus]|uniref:Uncharacterized protein n=1 Tax=Bacillus cereus TaxID=1396 RepID=A0AAW5L2Z3_BACCE|nr:hypothetical protein [Bacillus cereus]MCQ6288596.1 hypothetical protein [Bacillus cereus]MCQ6317918.1 hypothetical protein [Bacillus cereus]MCQ6329099.1 hypothetical protein [Bacillus cereus]MCQ6385761.1 hypothetical protein [Bacillus cereus]
MANKIYQFSYDDQLDKDIHEWLKSIPRSRKAETVRHAIRFYIACNGGSNGIHMPSTCSADIIQPTKVFEKETKKKKPKLPIDGNF